MSPRTRRFKREYRAMPPETRCKVSLRQYARDFVLFGYMEGYAGQRDDAHRWLANKGLA